MDKGQSWSSFVLHAHLKLRGTVIGQDFWQVSPAISASAERSDQESCAGKGDTFCWPQNESLNRGENMQKTNAVGSFLLASTSLTSASLTTQARLHVFPLPGPILSLFKPLGLLPSKLEDQSYVHLVLKLHPKSHICLSLSGPPNIIKHFLNLIKIISKSHC